MKIIPVIDLKNGIVVHAKQGQRAHYQPMLSALCPSSDVYAVIHAYLAYYPFDTFYIADLDAITGQGHQTELINAILLAFPNLLFWVDQGGMSYQITQQANYIPVLGSESYHENKEAELKHFQGRFVLSLDYQGNTQLGAHSLFTRSKLWPNDIIIMTLDRVGSTQGPDFAKLQFFCQQYPNKTFIAAGGIRNNQDLIALKKCGIHYALVASALHSGNLNLTDISTN